MSFFKSFVFAFKGIGFVLKERNFRVMLLISLLTLIASLVFAITSEEWHTILLCIGLVLGLEMLNSALEGLVDLVQPDHHPQAGKIKDLSAGAVLLASLFSSIIGLHIFWKYIF
jgi:diacylglycerol kinase